MEIDTLAYTKELETGGIDRKTAETLVIAFTKLILPVLVTKADLKHELERLEHRMTLRLGGLLVTGVGIIVALQHFWK